MSPFVAEGKRELRCETGRNWGAKEQIPKGQEAGEVDAGRGSRGERIGMRDPARYWPVTWWQRSMHWMSSTHAVAQSL